MKKYIKQLVRWALKPEIRLLEAVVDKQEQQIERASEEIDRIRKEFQVGVDVNMNTAEGSWAVVCLQGETMNFVKFVDLRNENVRYIQRFLEQFEDNRTVVDPPYRQPFFTGPKRR